MSASTDTLNNQKRAFQSKRSKGWGMGLYRNTDDAKVAGVCSGIAEYIEMDKGLLRILTLASVLFTSGGSAILYGAAWLALSPRPEHLEESAGTQSDTTSRTHDDTEQS
ncbi:PspC domain-containing protein [Reinekea sp.]|jgi:phage shock protein PspC (stress-responsive transcriptional regulator)|uniref:PspC domain-containing protein n=1 Tax=Reinekea sp. TaxID=1970455 RepID=UPI003988D2B9